MKVFSNIRWFKKELHKLRHRHNRACRACEHVARRLNAMQQGVPERVLKPMRKPANMAARQSSVNNTKPVGVQLPHYNGHKAGWWPRTSKSDEAYKTKVFYTKHALGKWNASNEHRRSTDGLRDLARSRTGCQSDGGAPAWFTSLCKRYGFLRKMSRPSLF